jgi:phage antirepressor YoqD-like protein
MSNIAVFPVSQSSTTMSSREIAELVHSRHDAVRKSAERLESAQILTSPLKGFDYEHNGNIYQEYRFNKRDSLVIVARLSPEFTATVIDRWQELEAGTAPKIPQTMAEALRLAADQAEEIERQQAQIEAAKPALEFVERHADSSGLVSLTQAAKDLKFKPRTFTKALEEDGYLYRTGGALTPYQRYLDQGLLQMVNGERGGYGYSQTMVTNKGKQYFAARYASEL